MCGLTPIALIAATANASNAALLTQRPNHWKSIGEPPVGMTPQDMG
jgi:hypothetical protein